MKLAIALSCVVIACGCASGPAPTSTPASKGMFIGYRFTGGDYSKLLEDTFGDDAHGGVTFFVLRNAWSRVDPNGLLISAGRARYVWVDKGKTRQVDKTPSSCPQLGPLLADFDTALSATMEFALGTKAYPAPTRDILDGPDYVIEARGENANVVIDPTGSRYSEDFPSVAVAIKITQALKQCHDG